ncbi:hypothetical protein RB597_007799 [Gaeumannomyces tritici]
MTASILRREEVAAVKKVTNPNPPSMGALLSSVVWFLTALALVFLVLRLYSKYLRGKGFWWDDYILGAAWHMLLLSSVCVSLMVRFDFGRHSADIPADNLSPILFLMTLQGFLTTLAAAWSKTSFGVTLLRLAGSFPGRWSAAALWGIIVSVNVVLGAAAVVTWAQCDPVELNWAPWSAKKGSCWDGRVVVGLMQGAIAYSGVADLALAFMPWAMLWKANMSARNKYSVLCAMSMSVFAGAASFAKAAAFPTLITGDLLDSTQLIILTAAEISITIMAACIPIMRTLWIKLGETIQGSTRDPSPPARPAPPPAPSAAEVAPAPAMYPRISRDMSSVVGKLESFSTSSSTVNTLQEQKALNRALC